MVLLANFQDVFESLPKDAAFSMPAFKEISWDLTFGNNDEFQTVYSGVEPPLPFANSETHCANIIHWRRLTAVDDSCKDVYEVTFDVKDSHFDFKAGDTIGVISENIDSEVEAIISHLELSSKEDLVYSLNVIDFKKAKVPNHIPIKSTLKHVFKHCIEIRSVLKKLFLLALSRYTKEENERKVLEYLCSKEGTNAYQTHILNRNLCILDIFSIFKSCKPPVQVLLANLPRLLPRPYSIVNSGQKNASILKICFSVMPLENNRKGLTTSWLENAILNKEHELENLMSSLKITNKCDKKLDFKVPIYLRKNMAGFVLPTNLENPLILIGPGTGVSPFIGFLEEIEEYRKSNLDSVTGDVWLFFGCRNPDLDFIYREELGEFVSRGVLTKLFTAFSRVENDGVKYIQDAIMKNSNDITSKIESGATIFVCGDVRTMAVQIKDALIQCLIDKGKTKDEATKIIADMQTDKRYFVEVWS